jgi:hypothetical protein
MAGIVLLGTLAAAAAQSAGSPAPPAAATAGASDQAGAVPAKFEIADIHPSPPRRFPIFDGGFLVNGRYLLRQATLADLITTAYGQQDSTFVHGGPSWLEWDRWDVIAKVPPGTTALAAPPSASRARQSPGSANPDLRVVKSAPSIKLPYPPHSHSHNNLVHCADYFYQNAHTQTTRRFLGFKCGLARCARRVTVNEEPKFFALFRNVSEATVSAETTQTPRNSA